MDVLTRLAFVFFREQITEAAREEEGYYIRDGIVVVLRNGTIRDNTTI